jgi:hypothetical protein
MWRRVVVRKLENTANTATAKNQKAREKSASCVVESCAGSQAITQPAAARISVTNSDR